MRGLTSVAVLLIAARFIKGAAAAFTAPAGLSIITTSFPEGPARNRCYRCLCRRRATGFSSVLIIGGLLTGASWRWAFMSAAPAAAVLIVTGWCVIPRDAAPAAAAQRLDGGGALTLTAAMLAVVWSVVRAQSHGWFSSATLAGFAVALAAVAAFVVTERRHPQPLVRLGPCRCAHRLPQRAQPRHRHRGRWPRAGEAVRRFESAYRPYLDGGPVNFTDYIQLATNQRS